MADVKRRSMHPDNHAGSPNRISLSGWWEIAKRVLHSFSEDRVLLVAAGVTFYLLLALFPALAAMVSLYGLVADPATISAHLEQLSGVLPEAALGIISTQLDSLAAQNSGALGLGFALGLAIALWSANGGVKALFEAMNIAYDETEKRGFLHLTLLTLAFTLGGILLAVLFIIILGVVPAVLSFLDLGPLAEWLVALMRWVGLLFVILLATSLLYRFGPSRERAKWRWVSVGAAFATLGWVVTSWAFSFYLQNFADYNATYGALGAVIGMMMWIWISVIVLIAGAEINAETERQTARDTTTGAPEPIGHRGADVADRKDVSAAS